MITALTTDRLKERMARSTMKQKFQSCREIERNRRFEVGEVR